MNHSLILAVVLALAMSAPSNAATTVPFELLRSGHMAVQVKINGKGPYRLIFDTGAPITLLNNKIARETGLLKGARQPSFPIFGSAGEVRVKRLEVGGQAAENVAAIVVDHPTVEAISRALGPIDGIVGFPFFARFTTTLDYQARTLTFEPNTFQPPDVMRTLMIFLMAGGGEELKVLAPAGQWGFTATKDVEDEKPGVSVDRVLAGGSAAKAGLAKGDRLLTLDGRWTDSLADLFAAAEKIKPGTTVISRVLREGQERELRIAPKPGL